MYQHAPDSVPRVVVLGPRLFPAGDHALGAAQVHDHVAPVEALDLAGEQLSDSFAILAPDDLALGLFHLLVDHLLRRLGGDAGQRCVESLPAGLDHLAQLSIGANLTRVGQGDLGQRVGDVIVLDDRLAREDQERPALPVELGAELFLALVVLARGRGVGLLDGLDDHV